MNTNVLYKGFVNTSVFIADNFKKLTRLNNWIEHIGFSAIDIDKRIWSLEPLLNTIDQQFKIKSCGILRIEPFTIYDWHKDTNRGLTINMLLKEVPSHSVFGFKKDDYNTHFVELNYVLKKFYLFNTQHLHSVINFEEYRYVFSTEFEKEKDQLNYQSVFNWCKQQGLLDE